MAQELVDGALNSKSILSFSGSDVNVSSVDGNLESKQIESDNKKAIHEALNQVNEDLGIKKKDDNN